MLITQPKWPLELRMPARELQVSPTAPYGVSSSLMKRHKTLPHPNGKVSESLVSNRQLEKRSDVYRSRSTAKPRVLTVDTGIPSSPTSQTSSPRTLKHASKRIGVPDLPPTPPTHSRQSSSGNAAPVPVAAPEPTKSSVPSTPTNQQSPPTPDVTPPRMAPRPKLNVSRPPSTSERYASSRTDASRTDSFKTAREHPYSSDEDEQSTVRPILTSAGPSQTDIPQIKSNPVRKIRDIGLGLGLESDNDLTPSPRQPQRDRNYFQNESDEFETFDGEWSSAGGETTDVEREWDDNLQRNVTVRRRPAQKLYNFSDSPRGEVLEDNPVTPTNATRLLREYPMLESFGNSPLQSSERTPKDKYRSGAPWPTMKNPESPSTPDVRRFSTMSARSNNSTVIEAMVVETIPQRQKTLRHTKKQLGLREFSSDQSTQSSVAGSTFSSELPHRLIHKSSGMFHRGRKHNSLSSTTASTISTRSRKEIWSNGSIPVVVVPERRSSMKSSRAPSLRSTSSRRTKRSLSLSSAPLSNSSKANEPGYFEVPKRNPRRMSESAGSSHSQRTIDFPPTIPIRRSSLSAPTSRNTSRAGSLTAESLKAHNFHQLEARAFQPVQPQISPESHKELSTHLSPRLSVDQNGDPFFGSRLSTHVTPISSVSHETAGTFQEISEAQAMALYPHQNKSVLVVEQPAPSASSPQQSSPRSTETVKPPAVVVNGIANQVPVTPPQPVHISDEVDSPLRNPRDPPQPPAIKFIPPTPAILTPGTEEQRQLGYDVDDIPPADTPKPKRGLSLIRRALTNRRFSESGIVRSFSTKRREAVDDSTQTAKSAGNSLYPSVSDQPKDDSKLHPFWRPAHFWDDLEDDDYNDDYLGRDPYPPIDNRPGPPKRSLSGSLKRTFAILPIRDEHGEPHWTERRTERRTVRRTGSGTLRVVKNRGSNESLRRSTSSPPTEYNKRPHRTVSDGHRPYTAPGYGSGKEQASWMSGVKGLSRRMSEKRREKRNDKLRAMISGPRDAIDGVARVVGSGRETVANSNGERERRPSVPARPEWPDQQ